MRLGARARAAAPPEAVMARLTDYPAHEARARARGLDVDRLGAAEAWVVRHELLGARRETRIEVVARDPSGLRLATDTGGVASDVAIRLAPLGDGATEIAVDVAVTARTLGARLAMGPVRMAGGEIERRLRAGLEAFARGFGAG